MKAAFIGVALLSTGVPAANATVEVRKEFDGNLASIYSDEAGSVPIANPSAFADANGRFAFYADGIDRGYSVKVTKDAFTYTVHNVAVGNAAQRDVTAFMATMMLAPDQATAIITLMSVRLERALRRSRLFSALNLV